MYEILRDNLVRLRKNRGLTQVELAEILKYSDKSVSKWETGETLPSIETLVHLSDFYGVPVDDLLRKPVDVNKEVAVEKIKIINKKIVIALAISAVWLLAVAIFVGLIINDPAKAKLAWICFVWALPCSIRPSENNTSPSHSRRHHFRKSCPYYCKYPPKNNNPHIVPTWG